MERVAFVVAGVILASLINKFILPYKLEDANSDLWSMYNDTVHEMLVEAKEKVKGGGDQHAIKNLLLITTMVEDRLKLNNQDTQSTDGVAWLKHQRRAANTLYELYGWIDQHGLQESNIPAVNMGLQVLLEESIQETGLRQAIVEMEQVIHSTPRIEDRMVLSMILEVMEEKYSAMLTR